ncbi:LuxR C-terminal-related transcriptional regulator [Streptomyces sp. NPDC056373]|uniref:LuxR family transcriptional regulator AbsR2 n=1 Tax=Streptomyces sp. NPDC056373 TaxID=3345798 RepID=UPI0035DF979D
MTTYERDARTPEPPWPFTGREDELELVRRSATGARRGIVVTGPAGFGKTRLVTEAIRGTDCARAAGTPESRSIPFAAFAHLLPESVTLPRAVQVLAGVRTLLVDDAHLLDGASAALVHQLAVHGRTRLLVVATDGSPVPGAISRLWTGELLPRLVLQPLPEEETAALLNSGAGPLDALTANRLRRLCRGDLRLLRGLLGSVRGLLTPVPGTGERAWRGPVPLTPAVRERTACVLGRADPFERDVLDRLAFAEPLPPGLDELGEPDLGALEVLESDDLIEVDDEGAVRLAHPLYGPALRAAAGRLRARRLARTPDAYAAALDAEAAALAHRIEQADVRATATPVGEWLVAEGGPLPAGYAAVRARFARLRGEVREAAAWAREGLRGHPEDASCRTELDRAEATTDGPAGPRLDRQAFADPYDAVRLGAPERAVDRLGGVFARHADALTRADGPDLDEVAAELERRGFLLFAAEAYAQAVRAHRDPGATRHSRTRAVALARRCQGARTPALSGLVLGELTARQRQIVTLAAAGLTNRQIADRLTLSVRTVGNHLYSAYARLGTSDRGALPWPARTREAQPA